jgi:NADH dehydrogenase
MDADGRTRIVILGGGFGGLYAALRLEKTLARDPDVEILLVNRENFSSSHPCSTKSPLATSI